MAAAGDARARRLLVSRLAPRVHRICRAIVGDHGDAEDATQLALVEVLAAIGSYSGAGRLESWADSITARTASKYDSRERRRWALFGGTESSPASVAQTEPALAESLARPLSVYLDALPRQRREVLVLRHALGYSVGDIATMLEIPEGTVKDRLVRGRKLIRKLIARDQAIGAGRGTT